MSHEQKTVDKILALESLDGLAFEEHYQLDIIAALPSGAKAGEAFWSDLDSTINGFMRWELKRLKHPPLAERGRWQRVVDQSAQLLKELRPMHQATLRTYREPDWATPALKVLTDLKARAERHVQAYSNIAKGHSRRRNDSREFLYEGIFHLWTKHLHQELGRSRDYDTGVAGGPLIRFTVACIEPILQHDSPTDEALVDIIRRAQRRHGVLTRKK